MRYKFVTKEISKSQALEMIMKYHYSNSLPKLNKHFLGFYLGEELVGVITLGWGTRPLHTIRKLFPNMTTNEYFEIGRMCMTDEMPRNSESQMISECVRWIKQNCKDVKVLFTWADGMLGKCGYVYQASGFNYTGYVTGEMYLKDGLKIHIRQTKKMFGKGGEDNRLTARPTKEQMKENGIKHYKGKQFRYIRFICSKKDKKKLMRECIPSLSVPFPKEADLKWKVKNLDTGTWEESSKPYYITDYYSANCIQLNLFSEGMMKDE